MKNPITLIVSIFIFVLLIAGYLHPISAITQDLGRHIKVGEIITTTLSVPKTNMFSYTHPDFPFINHHWFSEVIFYLTHQVIGFHGLLVVTVFVVSLAFLLIYFYSLQRFSIVALAIVSVMYLRILFERTDVRPEIFSFLLLSSFVTILFIYREKFTRLIFLLPVLQLLWTNIHIYFVIGIAVLGIFLLDDLFSNRKNVSAWIRKRQFSKKTIILFLVFITSCLITFINPHGLDGVLYPFRVFDNYGYTIEENQNIFFLESLFYKPSIIYFKIAAAFLLLNAFFQFKKTRFIDVALILFFSILGAIAVRNFSLFVFGTFISAVYFMTTIEEFIRKKTILSSYFKYIITILFIGVYIYQLQFILSYKPIGFGLEAGAKKATDFLIENDIHGPMFNNFDIGSYLIYRLYPKEKVFIDGRPEAYPASFIQTIYIPMQTDLEIFKQKVKEYKIQTIFFSHTDQTPWAEQFLKSITQNSDWKIVYLDDYVVILIQDSPENKKISYKVITENTISLSHIKNSPIAYLRLARFFNIVDWKEKEIDAYEKILADNPTHCSALQGISNALGQSSPSLANTYVQRLLYSCK